jgi:hypothetical protein
MTNITSLCQRILSLILVAIVCHTSRGEPAPARQRLPFPDSRLEVFGLPWFSEDKPALRRHGDRRLVFVDGLKMLNQSQTAGRVDGVHCNSLGFYFNAQGLEPFLRDVLKSK